MNRFLKNIENSENNNPALTAALQEIDRLNKKILEIQAVVEGPITSTCLEGESPRKPGYHEENVIKIGILSDLLA